MKQILVLAVLALLISISISILQPNKENHYHQNHPKKHLNSTKIEKKCKLNERLKCNKKGLCVCLPIKKVGVLSKGDIVCRKGFRKCYLEYAKKYKCYSNLLNITCLPGPMKHHHTSGTF